MASDAKIARVLSRLEEALREGNYYAALQMYRTVVKRKVDGGALDEARGLLVTGAVSLLSHGKVNEGLDLGE
jgi:hypothetical protein